MPNLTSVFSPVKWKEGHPTHSDAARSSEMRSGKAPSQWLAHCKNWIFLCLSAIIISLSLIGVWNKILNLYRNTA